MFVTEEDKATESNPADEGKWGFFSRLLHRNEAPTLEQTSIIDKEKEIDEDDTDNEGKYSSFIGQVGFLHIRTFGHTVSAKPLTEGQLVYFE